MGKLFSECQVALMFQANNYRHAVIQIEINDLSMPCLMKYLDLFLIRNTYSYMKRNKNQDQTKENLFIYFIVIT